MKLEMALDDLAIQTGGLLLGTGKESGAISATTSTGR